MPRGEERECFWRTEQMFSQMALEWTGEGGALQKVNPGTFFSRAEGWCWFMEM